MSRPPHRREFLKGALAIGALLPLAACTGGNRNPSGTPEPTDSGTTTQADPENPFGLRVPSDVDAAIFSGGYGVDYAEYAADMVESKFDGVKIRISKVQDATKELQSRFTDGVPPDVMDNAGGGRIALLSIIDQLEDLNDVIDSHNYEGEPIRDTLYAGVLEPGTVDGQLAVINYVLTVFGLWYSASLFEENGWEPPQTWDDAIELGAKAKEKGKYLFLWGNEAADYFMELAITSAIKEGGDGVRIALDNLEEGCWSQAALQAVFIKIEEIVQAGYVKSGGSGTQYTAAQAAWSQTQEALLYPSGSWIEHEMKDQTKEDFKLMGTPVPTISTSSSMPFEAIHSAAGEPYIVPSQGKNVAGGKEFLRAMLSEKAAKNFTEERLSLTVVRDTVPDGGFTTTALTSQIDMLGSAGENVFTWKFQDYYGLSSEFVALWNPFLEGQMTAAELTAGLQEITDGVRNDDSIEKFTVS